MRKQQKTLAHSPIYEVVTRKGEDVSLWNRGRHRDICQKGLELVNFGNYGKRKMGNEETDRSQPQ